MTAKDLFQLQGQTPHFATFGEEADISNFCLFVSDKGHIFIAAMKSVSEFPKALKMFAKEVGLPEAIISDSHKCHESKEV